MNLRLMNDTQALDFGAVCLDGTPAGFYYSPATNESNANDWEIHFQGGGWCVSVENCYERSLTRLGSSKFWTSEASVEGMMSDNCTTNPDFCNFNRVYIPYCDGNSFSGNRDDPVLYNETNLYFRGFRVLEQVLLHLMPLGLSKASSVLLTGCSAGGLATYLHTNYVGDFLKANVPSVVRYKSAPNSGFFLLHDNVLGQPVYPQEIETIFELANSTTGVTSECIEHVANVSDQWVCNFAQYNYEFAEYPVFMLNSALDMWQGECIWTVEEDGQCGGVPFLSRCQADLQQCDPSQMAYMIEYQKIFLNMSSSNPSFTKPGNGAFLYSCHLHCAEISDYFFPTIRIGGLSMREALSQWWYSESTAPAAENTHIDCVWSDVAPYRCNPTCPMT